MRFPMNTCKLLLLGPLLPLLLLQLLMLLLVAAAAAEYYCVIHYQVTEIL